MDNVVVFIPKDRGTGAQNLLEFINFARDELTLFCDQGGFSVDKWKYTIGTTSIVVPFSQVKMGGRNKGQRDFTPFDQPFMDFAKAYIRNVLTRKLTSSIRKHLNALRYVYVALIEIHKTPDILKLDGIVQAKVIEIAESQGRMGQAVLYQFGQALENLYLSIRTNKIVIELPNWKSTWKKPRERSIGTSNEDRKWQEERCPSMHEMLCLMDAFNRAVTVPDRYVTGLIMMLIFAPGRVSELNYLTEDCLIYEEYEDKGVLLQRMGIRWYAAKGFAETIKWVPRVMEPVVTAAVSRLLEISSQARDAAKFYYENEIGFFCHAGCLTSNEFNQNTPLNGYQIHAALGLTAHNSSSDKALRTTFDLPKTTVLGANPKSPELNHLFWDSICGKKYITYNDLGCLSRKVLPNGFPYIQGTKTPLWKSLVLTWEFATNRQFGTRPYKFGIPTLNSELVNHALASRPNKGGGKSPSIFDIFDLNNEDGSRIKLTSHQLRVWLSTNAERANMESLDLAQWAGRLRPEDNRHYDLRTRKELEQREREILDLTPSSHNALQQAKSNGPVSYEAFGYADRLGMAEITSWGFCLHDFTMEPCTKGGNCLACQEHCAIKGLSDNLEQIKIEEKLVQAEFDRAREAVGLNYFGASRWVDHYGYRLALIRTQIVKLEDPDIPEGTIIKIPQEFDPSQTKRALQNAGFEIEIAEMKDETITDEHLRGLLGTNMKTKLINDKTMSRILHELDGWQGKLTWPLVGVMVAKIIGAEEISRHTLLGYPQLVQAFRIRKHEIKTGQVQLTDFTLDAALAEIEQLNAKVARLERERNLYIEQFARWQHNLYTMPNVDMVSLNRALTKPLPKTNRANRG